MSHRTCPLCAGEFAAFESFGVKNRPNARCPRCGSKGRHRLEWLFLQRHTDLFDGAPKRMLHLAPEKRFVKIFSRLPGLEYLSADLDSPLAMVRLDLARLGLGAERFDVILCSHVLEHVPDDRSAMAELYRVLRPGGWALFAVPVFGDSTYEDAAITSPEARLLHFGQSDHVRKYGRDIGVRLAAAGFAVQEVRPESEFSADERERFALSRSPLFYCTKPPCRASA